TPLAKYDIRLKRELAHRRFAVSVVRQILRLVSLHALDAVAVGSTALGVAKLLDTTLSLDALLALVAFMLAGLNVRASYRAGDARRDSERILSGALIGVVLAALPGTIINEVSLSREYLVLFGLARIAALLVERQVVDAVVHQAYIRGIGLRRALVVARAEDYEDLLDSIAPATSDGRRAPAEDQVIIGYVTPEYVQD